MTVTATHIPQIRLDHQSEVRDLLGVAEFLAPEVHRDHGAEEAAAELADWANGDRALIAEAERMALRAHHEDTAHLLHLAAAAA